jgi:protein involved in polysaccharide export with SLBB domain
MLKKARALVVALFCLGGPACGPQGRGDRPPIVGAEDTTLGVSDVFDVRVYGEDSLSSTYQVDHEGQIDFPFVGQVRVSGLEPGQVANQLESMLRDGGFLVNPQVSIFVQQYNSKRISILGAVRNPGSFPMQSGLTVVQAIGVAGGFTSLANHDGTVVTRRVDGEMRRYAVHVDSVTGGREDDFRLQAQDIIYVPERVF